MQLFPSISHLKSVVADGLFYLFSILSFLPLTKTSSAPSFLPPQILSSLRLIYVPKCKRRFPVGSPIYPSTFNNT